MSSVPAEAKPRQLRRMAIGRRWCCCLKQILERNNRPPAPGPGPEEQALVSNGIGPRASDSILSEMSFGIAVIKPLQRSDLLPLFIMFITVSYGFSYSVVRI